MKLGKTYRPLPRTNRSLVDPAVWNVYQAAPDLLAACRVAYDALEHEDSTKHEDEPRDPVMDVLRAAIVKAGGVAR